MDRHGGVKFGVVLRSIRSLDSKGGIYVSNRERKEEEKKEKRKVYNNGHILSAKREYIGEFF